MIQCVVCIRPFSDSVPVQADQKEGKLTALSLSLIHILRPVKIHNVITHIARRVLKRGNNDANR